MSAGGDPMTEALRLPHLALGCALAVMAPGIAFAIAKAPQAGRSMAVVMPTTMSRDEVTHRIESSGALITREGVGNTAIVEGDADTVRKLYANGAWFVGDASQADLCISEIDR
jgi:hypothetical protein